MECHKKKLFCGARLRIWCNLGCPYDESNLGDGRCTQAYNIPECNYDGGDCGGICNDVLYACH